MIGRRALLLLVLLATAVRVLALVADPHPAKLAGLSAGQGEVARNIVDHGQWFVIDRRAARSIAAEQLRESRLIDPSSFDYSAYDARPERVPELVKPLGPALVLAGLWTLPGDHSYIWLQLLQLAIGALLTLVIVWLSLALFGRPRAALAAGALWAVSPTLAYLGVLPLYEIWAVFATLVAVSLYVRARQRGGAVGSLLVVGLAIGLGTLFRQGIVLLVPALALAELGVSGRQALRTAAIVGLGCLLALVPWTVRNLHEFGELRPTNGVGGQVLWQALGEDTATFGAVNDDGTTLEAVHAVRPDLEYGTPAYDSYLLSKALSAIGEHPLAYAKLVALRGAEGSVLNSPDPPGVTSTGEDSEEGGPGSRLPLASVAFALSALFDPLLFVVAAATTFALWRTAGRQLLLLWLSWASVLVVPLFVSGSHPRYVAPGLAFLMVLAGLAADLAPRWLLAVRQARRGAQPRASS